MDSTGQRTSVGGTGLDTARMQQAKTYRDAGWDLQGPSDGLADTWYIPRDGGYPELAVFAMNKRGDRLAGLGTASRPFLISTSNDLAVMRRTRQAGYYRLTADIDLSGTIWRSFPLGGFSGAFDGNGHRIRNVTIQDDSSDYTGLFESVDESSRVFGLGLENVNIRGGEYVGGLAASCHGTIASCYVTGRVGSRGDGKVGGLVGRNTGRIAQSYARCHVTGGAGDAALGGLVGCNYSGAIINCYATGPVSPRLKPAQSLREAARGMLSSAIKQAAGAYNNLAGENPYRYCENVWDFDRGRLSQSLGGYARITSVAKPLESWLAEGWDFAGERGNGTVDLWLFGEEDALPQLTIFSGTREPRTLRGRGVPDDPYRIATAEDFGAIYYHGFAASYRLEHDIDLSGITWCTAPLIEFHGQLDGGGHVIRNLTVRGHTDLGLFGELGRGASVRGLGLGVCRRIFLSDS
jgi:hypothetical protein